MNVILVIIVEMEYKQKRLYLLSKQELKKKFDKIFVLFYLMPRHTNVI